MNRLDVLEKLVDELIKKSPDEQFIKDCMMHVNLPFSPDPVERINTVLQALHSEEPKKDVANGDKEIRI